MRALRGISAVIGAASAAALIAGAAAAFPSLPHFGGKPKPAPAPAAADAAKPAAAPGIYYMARVDTALYLVDAASIADGADGRRTASIFVLEHSGLNRRDVEDFDCRGHRMHKVSGVNFKLTADGADVTVYKTLGWKEDHADPERSLIRLTEDFVCAWPNVTTAQPRLSDIPEEEHARLVKLGQSAVDILSH
jgi:hypothetical protein